MKSSRDHSLSSVFLPRGLGGVSGVPGGSPGCAWAFSARDPATLESRGEAAQERGESKTPAGAARRKARGWRIRDEHAGLRQSPDPGEGRGSMSEQGRTRLGGLEMAAEGNHGAATVQHSGGAVRPQGPEGEQHAFPRDLAEILTLLLNNNLTY